VAYQVYKLTKRADGFHSEQLLADSSDPKSERVVIAIYQALIGMRVRQKAQMYASDPHPAWRALDSTERARQASREAAEPRARLTSCLRHCENTNSEESAHERFVSNRITEPYIKANIHLTI
jgi:hypothetical protein